LIQATIDKINNIDIESMSFSRERAMSNSFVNEDYCLNIEFLAEDEKVVDIQTGEVTYNTNNVFYSSVFSSE
jgi:hypothetical protein